MSIEHEHDYNNPIRKGRAKLCCRECGEDITIELVFIADALAEES